MLSLEEQERLAYISGDTAKADLLAQLIDTDATYDNGYDDGYAEGRSDGYEEGRSDGYEEGRSDGYEEAINSK